MSQTVGSTTTTYLVDTLNPTGYSQVMDELVSGSVTRTFTYGLRPISENQLVSSTWTPSFYGFDGHGNVRFLASTSGTLTDNYQFDAFGMPIYTSGTTSNPFRYSGERFDSNLNFYYLRARYYNMLTGRFKTMDPVQGKIADPATLHKYVYTKNNPVNAADPTGLNAIPEYSILATGDLEALMGAYRIGAAARCAYALQALALKWAISGIHDDPLTWISITGIGWGCGAYVGLWP